MFGETRGREVAPRHRVGTKLRSDRQYLGIERSLQRAWAKGAGLIDEEFERPMVAVVNTYQALRGAGGPAAEGAVMPRQVMGESMGIVRTRPGDGSAPDRIVSTRGKAPATAAVTNAASTGVRTDSGAGPGLLAHEPRPAPGGDPALPRPKHEGAWIREAPHMVTEGGFTRIAKATTQ